MKRPTEAQIKKEIETLKDYRDRVRPTTAFGDSNTEAIGVQIRVLEEAMTEDEIYDEWEDDERLVSSAIDALNWRKGEEEQQSKGWKPLLRK